METSKSQLFDLLLSIRSCQQLPAIAKATEGAEMLLMHTWKVAASEHSLRVGAPERLFGCFNVCFTNNKSNKDGDLPIQSGDLSIQHGDLSIQHGDLTMQNGDLTMNHGDLTIKLDDFI